MAAIVILTFACDGAKDDDNFRSDVFACEEALKHLDDCCPGFDPKRVRCHYEEDRRGSCGNGPYEVVRGEDLELQSSESDCIRSSSCSDLIAHDVCTRAQNARPRVYDDDIDANAPDDELVCP